MKSILSNGGQTRERRRKSGGQALVLVTFALIAMCGMIGLAVDLGYSFFVKKSAQSAADAAAQAAIQQALASLTGVVTTAVCGAGSPAIECQPSAPVSCDAIMMTSNLYSGCQYALQNGFSAGGDGGRQNVTIQANQAPPAAGGTLAPTVPDVINIVYWVTVRTSQRIPQLFSAVLGNTEGLIAARATAAIGQSVGTGSLWALNEKLDCMSGSNCGEDFNLGGGGTILSPGPAVLGSECNGNLAPCDGKAGTSNNNSKLIAPSIMVHGAGTAEDSSFCKGTQLSYTCPGWTNGVNDPNVFQDPTRSGPLKSGLQPPIIMPSGIKSCGIDGGQISGSAVLGPYNYYTFTRNGLGVPVPNGAPVTLNGTFTFDTIANGGVCPGLVSIAGDYQNTSTANFPAYAFWGGLNVANNSAITFGVGEYVMAGAAQDNGGNAGSLFNMGGGGTTFSTTGSGPNYAGQLFIFTAPGSTDYSAALTAQMGVDNISAAAGFLHFGTVDLKAGNSSNITLNGYNYQGTGAPSQLGFDYNSFLFWQDRYNSTVKYNADGTYNCAPSGLINSADCNKAEPSPGSTRMTLNATAGAIQLNGTLYQPRGAWLQMQGGGTIGGALRSISGAYQVQGSGTINLTAPGGLGLINYVNALIE